MREIKFRVWDKINKKMFYCESSQYSIDPDYKTLSWYLNGNFKDLERIPFSGENTELMQYTGLKDKNGREIYEGDIIKHDFEYIRKALVKFGIYHARFDFDESTDGVGFYLLYGNNEIIPLFDNNFEVMGNLYENPELMEEVDE